MTTEFEGKALAAIRANPKGTLLALDFDGTIAEIINDPTNAYAHPLALDALARLGGVLGKVAVITGRPVEVAKRLGRFVGRAGLEDLVILGQYGVERWDAATGAVTAPPVPDSVVELEAMLPGWLDAHEASGLMIEHKGRAIVLHTRGHEDPAGTAGRLFEPVSDLAASFGLIVEPGKNVLEIRAGGYDKGDALRELVAEFGADQIIFAGDDLGDLPAFEAVSELRDVGKPGILICSASHEQDALVARADVVVEGPTGVAAWLNRLADELDA
ncbi:MAG: otsB [Nocardioidaceae bacterium]|nr:otsB [Nocardioidaceae bacterium]